MVSCAEYLQRKFCVNSLPVELLSYIFDLATHSDDECPDRPGHNGEDCAFSTRSIVVPLGLSSVSRHWRRVARSTPSLWTSLCVNASFVVDASLGRSTGVGSLNTAHLTSYLNLSRCSPLDILIDARDPDWDFSEAGMVPSCKGYKPPFTCAYMNLAMSLLLPHIGRWQSISILTDTWLVMHTALTQMSSCIVSQGAPKLRSLVLMRCNEFVSFAPEFQPSEMKNPLFLGIDDGHPLPPTGLPRLGHVVLRGVHTSWSSLASMLPTPPSSLTGLRHLELSSHCLDVRPSIAEFRQLLDQSPHLQNLIIDGSGPFFDDSDILADESHPEGQPPVSLPDLQEVTIGYRSAIEGVRILDMLDAPNLRSLTLSDSSYPADAEEVDAALLLIYVATGSIDATPHTTTNPRLVTPCPAEVPFPLLEHIVLRKVRACSAHFQTLFRGSSNLQSVEFIGMFVHCLEGLRPLSTQSSSQSFPISLCPCPSLRSLSIRNFDDLHTADFDFIIGGLSAERVAKGAHPLQEVSIFMDTVEEYGESQVDVNVCGNTKVFKQRMQDDAYWLAYCDDAREEFKVGGAFNDPVFDAYYAGSLLSCSS